MATCLVISTAIMATLASSTATSNAILTTNELMEGYGWLNWKRIVEDSERDVVWAATIAREAAGKLGKAMVMQLST